MTFKNSFQIALCLFLCLTGYSQNKLVGKVMDYNKEPVDNVQIYLDDKKVDVLVNTRGYFELDIASSVKEINIYSPEYGLLSSEYSGETNMSFMFLNPKHKKTKEDKVNIGYGKVDRKDLTYNVQSIDAEKDEHGMTYDNIYDLIRNRLSGVRVTGNNKIIIRGTNTVGLSTDPLFVVNGTIVHDIDYIRPIEVKDVSVLKGAATSIYGARGANGVIQITLRN